MVVLQYIGTEDNCDIFKDNIWLLAIPSKNLFLLHAGVQGAAREKVLN